MKTYKGRFIPKNPKKYGGDPTNIIYRSSWEHRLMKYLDENSNILEKAKIPVNATTIYTAHFLGAGGAKKLFSLPPDTIAAEQMPDAAAANEFIFYKKNSLGKPDKNSPRTVKEIEEILFEKVGKLEKGYEVALGKTSGVQLANASETNKDMKEQLQRDKSTQVAVTNKAINVNQTQTAQSTSKFDDRSALERKQATV